MFLDKTKSDSKWKLFCVTYCVLILYLVDRLYDQVISYLYSRFINWWYYWKLYSWHCNPSRGCKPALTKYSPEFIKGAYKWRKQKTCTAVRINNIYSSHKLMSSNTKEFKENTCVRKQLLRVEFSFPEYPRSVNRDSSIERYRATKLRASFNILLPNQDTCSKVEL